MILADLVFILRFFMILFGTVADRSLQVNFYFCVIFNILGRPRRVAPTTHKH